MPYINFNGKIIDASTPVFSADSRAIRFGDGLFETLKLKNQNLILANEHFARLWKGMHLLQFDVPKLLTPERLADEILNLAKKNGHKNARIRLGLFRGNGGMFDVATHQPEYLIQSWPLLPESSVLNLNGLQVCVYKDALKIIDFFSNIKHNNYLPYFMGALFAKKLKCNDALILNTYGRICDSSIANVFIVKNDTIFTPPLTEGCVSGIMRKYLLQQLPLVGFVVEEMPLTLSEILNADEVFLANSIYNIRWVAGVADKAYTNKAVLQIDAAMRQTNSLVFC